MNCKKLLAGILSAAMVFTTMAIPAFADDTTPNMTENTINVTNANAQDVLDGKYGDINGKTINFTENITESLDLARPTAYKESKTTYFNEVGSTKTEIEWSKDVASVLNEINQGTIHYYRTLKNVTFTANENITVAGFKYSAEHVYKAGEHDYVRGIDVEEGHGYYKHSSMNDITFKNLTFTSNFDASLFMEDCMVENITFDGCTFNGTERANDNTQAIHMLASSQYFKNTSVKNCKINNYFQGVYIQGVDGAEVVGNSISNTAHNAVALQSNNDSNAVKGTVKVSENYLSNITNRAIRFSCISSNANITISNNIMVNSGDTEGQLIKAESCAEGSEINLESNYWDNKAPSMAVSNMTIPSTTGITGGVWNEDVTKYCAEGYAATENAAGTYTVKEKAITWKYDKDSGIYTATDDTELGMMRFMFATDVDASNVSKIGIKYISSSITEPVDGETSTGKAFEVSGNANAVQGDIINISTDNTNNYYAAAFIEVGGKTYWSTPISCKLNKLQKFTEYTPQGGTN